MSKYIDFDWMKGSNVVSTVHFMNNGKITIQNYTEDILMQFIGKAKPTIDTILESMEDRVVEYTRVNIAEVLKSYGLREYDAYELCRLTHGYMFVDDYWIRFHDRPNEKFGDFIKSVVNKGDYNILPNAAYNAEINKFLLERLR